MLPAATPDVVFAPVEGGAVLFSIRDETYYSLNAVGVRVWQLLPPAASSLDELCAALQTDYPDVPLSDLRTDVEAMLDDLIEMGLVAFPPESAEEPGDGAPRVA